VIYFDNSATTQIHPEVIDAMKPYLVESFGNPSGKYYTLAEHAKVAVEKAREQIGKLFNCSPDEVVFTSGSTESNNLVLKGLADLHWGKPKRLITTSVEHPSILETAKYLQGKGVPVHFLSVDENGTIRLSELAAILEEYGDDVFLVSVVWGNNEIGTLNDLEEIAELCAKFKVLLHSDATQVAGKLPIDLQTTNIHFLSASAHKFHGPKGIGVCIIKKDEMGIRRKLTPLLHGGGQEFGYRSGTLAVHNIVGAGVAAEIARRDLQTIRQHLIQLEEYCKKRLLETFPHIVQFTVGDVKKIPGLLSVRFRGVNNELLIKKLAKHVAISTGSACSSSKPSHVLQQIGLSLDEVRSTVRLSFSRFNSFKQIDEFIALLNS